MISGKTALRLLLLSIGLALGMTFYFAPNMEYEGNTLIDAVINHSINTGVWFIFSSSVVLLVTATVIAIRWLFGK